MTATITSLEESANLNILNESLRPLLTNAMGSTIEVFDTSGPADVGPPPHRHPWEEIYVMLAGRLEITVDGQEPAVIEAGDVAHIPGDTVHSYRIAADETRFLTIFSKGNATSFFTEVADTVNMNPPDIPALVEVAQRHSVVIGG